MIKSFKDGDTEDIFLRRRVSEFPHDIQRRAQIRLMILNNSANLNDLRTPRGNRLEKLSGDRSGEYSIRVNDQWRICFEWLDGNAWNVEIVDYH